MINIASSFAMIRNGNLISEFDEAAFKKRNRDIALLFEISSLLSQVVDIRELLSKALNKVLGHLDFEAGRIYLIDSKKQFLRLFAIKGIESAGLEKVHVSEGFSGKAFRTRSFIAQRVNELEDKNRSSLLSEKGLKTIICVPLIYVGRPGGVMNLATSKIVDISKEEIDLLTAIGSQIAIAANNWKLYEELNERIKNLEEKKSMINFFAYSVSHDLKSPAIGMYGIAKRLNEKYSNIMDERGRKYCEQIMKTSKFIVTLVEKMNMFISSKESPLKIEDVDVREILEDIKNEFSEVFEQKNINWIAPTEMPVIKADRISISRVFQNLVENSIKYGGAKLSEIKIEYRDRAPFHKFSFADDGIGIPYGNGREKIFDPFQKNSFSKESDGAGLGLAIVKEIITKHGGSINLDDTLKIGTSIHFTLSKCPETEILKGE